MKAFIFAAGRGERMRPLTDTCPKPLLKILDKPLIIWHIEGLQRAGFEAVIVNNAWLGEQLIKTLGDEYQGMPIIHSSEGVALETAGAIAFAYQHLKNDTHFAALNGDIFCPDFDYLNLKKQAEKMHDTQKAYLYLVENPEHNMKGDFHIEEKTGQIMSDGVNKKTFAGIGVYRVDLFSHLAMRTCAKLAPLLREHMHGNIFGEILNSPWFDIGTPERLVMVNQIMKKEQLGFSVQSQVSLKF